MGFFDPTQTQVPYGSTSTQTQTYTPSAQSIAAYNDVMGRAQSAANLPYTSYSGELVAPINAQQQLGITGINQYAGWGQPYMQEAANLARQGSSAISGQDISRYINPYTTNVVQALQQQFANQNAQGLNALRGNAASAGALGGDRVGVASANYLSQQQLNQNPIIANLVSQGYTQAAGMAEQERQRQAQGAYSLGNIGTAGQTLALQGAGAQFGVGSSEQATQQLLDQMRLQQFQQAQAFPYQQAQWLAGITGGIAPLYGGTTSGYGTNYGYNTQLGPSQFNQFGGLAMAGLGAYLGMRSRGGAAPSFDDGGGVAGVPYGGMGAPYSGVAGFIPPVNMGVAKLPQQPGLNLAPPQAPKQQDIGTGNDIANNAIKIVQAFRGLSRRKSSPVYGSSEDAIYYRGGGVPGFADGGSFEDRWPDVPTQAGFGMGSLIPDDYDTYMPRADRWGEKYGPPEPYGPPAPLAAWRARVFDQMDPATEDRWFKTAKVETGGQGPDAERKFFETIANRGPSRGQSARYVATDPGYYPRVTQRGGVYSPEDAERYRGLLDEVRSGSNTANWATGNASGTVGFAGGPQTSVAVDDRGRPTGERFGIEGPDLAKMRALAFTGEADPGVINAKYAGVPDVITRGPVAGVGDAAPSTALGYASDDLGVASPATTGNAGVASRQGEKPNIGMALMAAGLGMMSSKAPGLGGLGEGGLKGLEQYSHDVSRQQQNRRIDLEAQRLSEAAERARAQLGETTRSNLASEKLAKEKLEQENWGTAVDASGIPFMYNRKTGETKAAKPPKPLPVTSTSNDLNIDASSGDTPLITDEQKSTAALATGAASRMQFKTPLTDRTNELLEARGITPGQFNFNAMRYALGDQTVIQGLTGKGGSMYRDALRARAAQWYMDQGMTPQDANAAVAEFAAMKAGARTLGNQEARMIGALEKAKSTAPVVLDASARISRTEYPTLNSIYLAALKHTGNQDVVRLNIALETLASNYGSTMGMGNSVLTDFQTKRAQAMLEHGYSNGQLGAAVDQILLEIDRETAGIKRGMRTFLGHGAQESTPTKTLSAQEQQALDWANSNPKDPRAAQIKQRLGVP